MLKHNIKLQERILRENRVSAGGAVTIKRVNATFGRNPKGLLLEAFKRILVAIGLKWTKSRISIIYRFILRCSSLYRTQGMPGLVLYLKACSVLLQGAIGGFILRDITPLKSRVGRTSHGLPCIIPRLDRVRIMSGDVKIIRMWLSLFALYRVLEFEGMPKLQTILGPFAGNDYPTYKQVFSYVPAFVKMLKALAKSNKVTPLDLREISPRAIVKSAPGTGRGVISTSITALMGAAANLRHLGLSEHIEYFIKYFKFDGPEYPGLLTVFQGAAAVPSTLVPSGRYSLGKLGFKEEAAGKVRVFAMVDAWTQWVLEPLHKYVFDLLRHIPMDGTFDQLRPVKAILKKDLPKYSLDLTAATDRLPMSLQQEIFSTLVDKEFGSHWASLLVDRDYNVWSKKYGLDRSVRYTVGQPMGALSSWASLALTHHFIVQAAAWEAKVVPVGTWFQDYAVLGDDIVICDSKVKASYLRIIGALGVECGIAKSLLSPKGLAVEFAKRTFFKGEDVSPISLTEFVASQLTLSDAIAFAQKYSLSFPSLIKYLGYGYKVRQGIQRHVGSLNSRVRALLFAFNMPTTETELEAVVTRGNPGLPPSLRASVLEHMKEHYQTTELKRLHSRVKALPMPASQIAEQGAIFQEFLLSKLNYFGFASKALEIIASGGSIATAIGEYLGDRAFSLPSLDRNFETYCLGKVTKAEAKALAAAKFPDSLYNTEIFSGHKGEFFVQYSLKNPPVVTLEVPTEFHNMVENQVRAWRFSAERVAKLVVGDTVADFNKSAKLIDLEIDGLSYDRTILALFQTLIKVLRELAAAGTGKVSWERELEPKLRYGTDPIQLRFWQIYTTALLKSIKSMKENKVKDN